MKKLLIGIFCLFVLLPIGIAQVITHQISDDGYAHVPLQFPFPLHGRTFTDSFMYSNGVVGFGSVNNHWCCSGYDLANARGYQFNYSIMGLQTDLINYGSGRFQTEGTPQYQRYRWENISEYGRPQNLNTFGVEIRPSGFIGIYHENINVSSYRPITVGITGDTEKGEYTQFYHGQGYTSSIPVSYSVQTTGDLCIIEPLSSPSCSGYQQAYLLQQCTINPLYNQSCLGYEQAYLNQQCSLNSLYSNLCPNYESAYHNQQCSLNPLYAIDCQGYAQAYFNEQCRLNPLYDRNCTGYAEAYSLANIVATPTVTISAPTVQVSTTGTVSVETPIVSDPVVNEVITRTPINTPNNTQLSASNNIQTNQIVNNEKQKDESKTEKKPESKQVGSTKKAEASNELSTLAIPTQRYEYKQPIILDLSYQKMIKKPIKDNNRAMYNLIMNSQLKHEEMVNEQYRR